MTTDLSPQIAKLEADLAELKRQNEKGNKKPKYAPLQVWKSNYGQYFLTARFYIDLELINIGPFNGMYQSCIKAPLPDNLTYVGMANDVIHVGKTPVKPVVTLDDAIEADNAAYYERKSGCSLQVGIQRSMQMYIDKNWPA
jgi:hypothetical protein